MAALIVKQLNSKAEATLAEVFGFEVSVVVRVEVGGLGGGGGSSDKVPGSFDGTAEQHAEDHPKDLRVRKGKNPHVILLQRNFTEQLHITKIKKINNPDLHNKNSSRIKTFAVKTSPSELLLHKFSSQWPHSSNVWK